MATGIYTVYRQLLYNKKKKQLRAY